MKLRTAVLAMFSVWAVAVGLSAVGAGQASGERSTWDGVFTEAQAERGATLYAAECANCHGSALEGMDMSPPLAGGAFGANWDTLSVGDLFERIRISMPMENPNRLTRAQKIDIVAFMLKRNTFPAGKEELPRETESMKLIKYVATKP